RASRPPGPFNSSGRPHRRRKRLSPRKGNVRARRLRSRLRPLVSNRAGRNRKTVRPNHRRTTRRGGMKLSPIDILIVVAYSAVILYIAGRSRRFAGKNLENYFLAGRNMPGWMTGISYAASMVSADAAVGYGGLAVVTGLSVAWIYLSRFGFALFLGAMLFAVFWRRLNTFTTLEFYELRFEGLPGTLMRFWLAFRTSLIAMVAWTGISLLALVKISEPVLGWGKTETLALAIPLSVFYVWFSGYLGVVLS